MGAKERTKARNRIDEAESGADVGEAVTNQDVGKADFQLLSVASILGVRLKQKENDTGERRDEDEEYEGPETSGKKEDHCSRACGCLSVAELKRTRGTTHELEWLEMVEEG